MSIQPLHKMQFMRSLIRIRNLCLFNCRTSADLILLHSLVNYQGHIISLDSFLKALAPIGLILNKSVIAENTVILNHSSADDSSWDQSREEEQQLQN